MQSGFYRKISTLSNNPATYLPLSLLPHSTHKPIICLLQFPKQNLIKQKNLQITWRFFVNANDCADDYDGGHDHVNYDYEVRDGHDYGHDGSYAYLVFLVYHEHD